MARQIEKGLSYIPLELDFFQDRKIRRLIRKVDATAPFVYIGLLCTIYREGYYINYDKDVVFDLSDTMHLDEEYVSKCISACISVDLLSREMYENHGVLTSLGIQRQYQKICEQCKRVSRVVEYSLLESSEEMTEKAEETAHSSEDSSKNEGKSGQSSELIPQSKVKESKVNKSKLLTPSPANELTEEEWKERILFQFVFSKNWTSSNVELAKFWAFYTDPNRKKGWYAMTDAEKLKAISAWKQQTALPKRFNDGFRAIWLKIYETSFHIAPIEIRMDMLADGVGFGIEENKFRLIVSERLHRFFEENMDLLKPILWPYIQMCGCTKLFYRHI